jgi:Tol biopolymer transport system component
VISDLGTSEVIPTAWSSDGRSILAACRLADEDPLGVCVVPVDERGEAGPVRQVTSADWVTLFQQRFSPDGRWISFMAVPKSDRSVATIYVMPAGGGQWVPVTEGGWYDDKPRWGPDGRTLYFISNRGGRSEVWGRRFDPMAGQPAGDLFRVMSLDQSRLALSPYVGQMDLIISASRIFLPMYEPAGKIWVLEPVDR